MIVSSPVRWLYLDLNSYFASVEQQLDPRLRGRPVAVSPVVGDSSCAIAASYEAKAFGIKTGTSIREARRLCPDLVVVHARHDKYVLFHERIRAEIERHLPITAVCSIDEVACRLLDNENSPEVASAIARRIKRGIAANVGVCLRSSIGIAPNRLLAKVASNMQKPDGLTILASSDLPHRLHALTLRDLPGVGRNMERRLIAAGVPDIESFLKLSPVRARRVWGSIHGERMWWELHGVDLPQQVTARRSIGHSHVLAPAFRNPAGAHKIARRLLVKAASRLRRLDFRTGELCLSVYLESRLEWSGSERLPATQDSFALLERLDRLWAKMLAELSGIGVPEQFKHVALTLINLTPRIADQPGLFDSVENAAAESGRSLKLSRALDAINTRFGRDAATLGLWDTQHPDSFTGTKIAFTRVPDMAEFRE